MTDDENELRCRYRESRTREWRKRLAAEKTLAMWRRGVTKIVTFDPDAFAEMPGVEAVEPPGPDAAAKDGTDEEPEDEEPGR